MAPPTPHHELGWRTLAVLAATYVGLLVLLAFLLPPLGHDEATYALGGRDLLHGDPTLYPLHRPIGMRYVAAVGVLLGGSDVAMRALPCALTTLLVLLAMRITRGIGSPLWTAAVLATSLVLMRRGAELSSDVASSVVLLLLVAVVLRGVRGRPWTLVWIGPLGALAFYLRYGTLPVTACILLCAVVVWRARWREWLVPSLVGAVVFAALLIPHVRQSLGETGDAFGILERSRQQASRVYVGDGVVYYLTRWWWRDLGPVATVLLVAGAYRAVVARIPEHRYFGLTALAIALALGISAHGEARYVLIPTILLVANGTDVLVPKLTPRRRLAVLAALVLTALAGAAFAISLPSARPPYRAATYLRQHASSPCRVLSSRIPQVGWYSGCRSMAWDNFDYAQEPTYWVRFSSDRPSAAALAMLPHSTVLVTFSGAELRLVQRPRDALPPSLR